MGRNDRPAEWISSVGMTVRVSLDARRMISTTLLIVGIGCLGVYGSSTLYAKFHQLYESWSFDKARERGVNTENQTDEGNAPFAIFTPAGKSRYAVTETKIVQASDVGVLAGAPGRDLTLVTCYPFHYFGNAPQRFIVHARKIE